MIDGDLKLKDYLKAEMHRSGIALWKRILFNPNYHALYLLRLVTISKNPFFRRYATNKLFKTYGIAVYNQSKIGIGLKMGHPQGIIIGIDVVIGKNCTIMQQVTIGAKDVYSKDAKYPTIGDNVTICAGAKVLGNINVADGTIIGANAVLLCDTQPNSVYAGVPAKRVK